MEVNMGNQKDTKKLIVKSFEYKTIQDKEDDEFFYFEGYLSTYGNVDWYDDVVEKGAFDESLKSIKPQLLWMHNHYDMIGVWEEIKSDDKGLFVKGKLPKEDTLVSGRVIPQMKVGAVKSMSIGFWVDEAEWDDDNVRHIKRATLVEGSLVGMPANSEAVVTDMKSIDIDRAKQVKTRRDFEELLRESGSFSKKSAVYLASKFAELKALTQAIKGMKNV
jgi:HK97 family phage prohead protease